MQVISVLSQKGGVGKTTISAHLGVIAGKHGKKVVLIDADSQGSLAAWWNARNLNDPAFANLAVEDLGNFVENEKKVGAYELTIIDTPPALTEANKHIARISDLIIIPIRPSPHDLRAISRTIEIVESVQKPMIFVINCAVQRARITAEAAIALSQHGTVAPLYIHQRVDFASSMIDGRTVNEIDKTSKSAKEIEQLWGYIIDRLNKLRIKKGGE